MSLSTPSPDATAKVGALIYNDTQAVYGLLADAAAHLRAQGRSVAGLLQRVGDRLPGGKRSFWLDDIVTGQSIRLDEPRGPGARACILDSDALARGAWLLKEACQAKPDLIIVSRFGSVEAEGGGLRAEIAEAICSGAAVLIPVREALVPDLEIFLGRPATRLAPSAAAIADWMLRIG